MKVILLQDAKSLGKKDDLIEVNDGYARNYLFPRKIAVEANSQNISTINQRKESEKNKKAKEHQEAKKMAEKLSKAVVVIKTKAGESGKLFGAITGKEISEKLIKDFNVQIDKKKILLSEPIKMMGSFEVEAKIYIDITAKFVVKVEAED